MLDWGGLIGFMLGWEPHVDVDAVAVEGVPARPDRYSVYLCILYIIIIHNNVQSPQIKLTTDSVV